MPAVPKPARKPKKQSKPLQSKSRLQSKKRLKSKPDPIPVHVKDEVDQRDGRCCQKCGRYFPQRVPGMYNHITHRAKRYEPKVRFWTQVNGKWDWIMVPVWFEFHSKENLVTLCPPPFGNCHTEAESVDRHLWEQWRDTKYRVVREK